MKRFLAFLGVFVFAVFPLSVFAQDYSIAVPSYVPYSSGCFFEVEAENERFTCVLPVTYIRDTFGFFGSGYNICNLTDSTVSGVAYSSSTFDFYSSPTQVDCRFQSWSTLELRVPYRSTGGYTSYQWESFSINEIFASNAAFMDEVGDRYTESGVYTLTEKILILGLALAFVAVVGVVVWRCKGA